MAVACLPESQMIYPIAKSLSMVGTNTAGSSILWVWVNVVHKGNTGNGNMCKGKKSKGNLGEGTMKGKGYY